MIVFAAVYLVDLLLYSFHFHTPLQFLLLKAKNSCEMSHLLNVLTLSYLSQLGQKIVNNTKSVSTSFFQSLILFQFGFGY